MAKTRTVIPGSMIARRAVANLSHAPDPTQTLTVSVLLRRPPLTPDPSAARQEIERLLSASAADVDAVTKFATNSRLRIVEISAPRRTIRLEGTVAQLETAFGTTLLSEISESGEIYPTYNGLLTVPSDLDGIIVAVLGLDQRPLRRRSL